jgi:hypothetical protein
VLTIAGVADHEAVEIGRRLVEAAEVAAVGRKYLHTHAGRLDADVNLAGRADRDVAMHRPERCALRRHLQPVGDGLVRLCFGSSA